MGHVEVKITLTNPVTGVVAEEKGLVDTGATLTVLPRKVAESLGLTPKAKSRVMSAGGLIMIELSDVALESGGKSGIVRVAISEVIDRVLIGIIALETLGLTVDPITGELKETFYLLYLSISL